MIATTHDMIMPIRHVDETKLTQAEKKEFDSIKANYIEKKYEMITEATNRKKSIPGHFHLHLMNLKNFH